MINVVCAESCASFVGGTSRVMREFGLIDNPHSKTNHAKMVSENVTRTPLIEDMLDVASIVGP